MGLPLNFHSKKFQLNQSLFLSAIPSIKTILHDGTTIMSSRFSSKSFYFCPALINSKNLERHIASQGMITIILYLEVSTTSPTDLSERIS